MKKEMKSSSGLINDREEKNKTSYEKDYHLEKHGYLHNDEEYYLARAKVAKHDYFNYYLDKNKKILEHGVGLGKNIYYFKNAVGYDVSKFAVDFCKKKGINATIDFNEIKDNSFDIVFSCHVLEHLENPLNVLKQMRKKLNYHGQLILILPIDKWKKPDLNDKDQHLYNWNFNTITNLLVRAGFYPFEYKIIRRTGFKKLLPFSRISFGLYLFLTKLAARVVGSRHMMIVAQKD